MCGSINWEMLKNQYFSNEVFREELFNMIQSPEGVSDEPHYPLRHCYTASELYSHNNELTNLVGNVKQN